MNLYKLAKLHDLNGDLSKRWFIGYHYLHPETRKYSFFKDYISTKLKTKTARIKCAQEMIRNINNRLVNGWNPFAKENLGFTTIGDAMEKILEIKKTHLKKRTSQTYSSYINSFMTWIKARNYQHMTIESFNYLLAQEFADYLKLEKGISNRTYNNYKDHFSAIFNELVDREYIVRNPFKRVKKLPETDQLKQAFTNDELQLFKDHFSIHSPTMYIIGQLVYYCALRPAEIVRLRVKYVDTDKGEIFVPGEISKSRRTDVIRIPIVFLEELQKLHLEKYNPNHYWFSRNLEPGTKEIAPTRLAERFKKEADKIGLERTLYELKHTGAGKVIDNGTNIRDLQKHLRHQDMSSTEKYLNAYRSATSREFVENFPQL